MVGGGASAPPSLPPPQPFLFSFLFFNAFLPEIRSAPEASTRGCDPRPLLLFLHPAGRRGFLLGWRFSVSFLGEIPNCFV
ncbi:hypothetical protein I3842_02G007700 [Carya illinoinensis]|uniref:Uncharacterized protein n=1 Tax=Carya illinoinensis TaxID=32201 RepID=A0A922K2R6_CARIL|nr:hypothetical protein I3842_02G007700 [Carya illinoinensis]